MHSGLCAYANPHCTMHMHVYILWNAQSHVYNSALYNALKTVHMPWLIKQGIAIPPSHSNAFSSWYVTTHDTTFVPWLKNLASGEILHALVGRRQWRSWRSLKNIFFFFGFHLKFWAGLDKTSLHFKKLSEKYSSTQFWDCSWEWGSCLKKLCKSQNRKIRKCKNVKMKIWK